MTRDRVYFDGYLPKYKVPTRLDRLNKSIACLNSLRRSHPDAFKCPEGDQFEQSEDPHQVRARVLTTSPSTFSSSGYRGTETVPFLVPAVIHALKDSKYAEATQVVPGEADPFCAQRARERGGMILTSDSDLLVYDVGAQGHVAFFDSVDFPSCSKNGKAALMAKVFSPRAIAAELKLNDLVRLAFELSRNPSTGLSSLLKAAKSDVSGSSTLDRFVNFESVYVGDPLFQLPSHWPPNAFSRYSTLGQYLDPRISEFLLQTLTQPTPETLNLYLWPLFEDVSRSSAWEHCTDSRFLAYEILLSHTIPPTNTTFTIHEHRRKGNRIVSTNQSYNGGSQALTQNITTRATALAHHLRKTRLEFSALHDNHKRV